MPRPFVAYLRVYEPLSAFEPAKRSMLERALERDPIGPADAGDREREMSLRAQLSSVPRLFPGQRVDGGVAEEPLGVLTLRPEDVLGPSSDQVGPGPLVCPLDLQARSAAALLGFLSDSEPLLRAEALPFAEEDARSKASSIISAVPGGAVHVVSSTWTVPLPWFAMVEPDQREVVLAPPEDPTRRVCWHIAMDDARQRVTRAHAATKEALGDDGPTKILRETGRWLEHFDAGSAVELDYGGLVQSMSDADLMEDTSAEDVQAIVTALEEGDSTEVAQRYERLQEFWTDIANRERSN